VRLTLLLKGKLSQEDKEKRKAEAKREAAQEDFHDLRVKLAMMAAAYEASKDNEEIARRVTEVREQLERPEVAELIEASRAPVAVAALCRRWGLPVRVERWLEMADEAMEQLGFLPDDDDPPADPPKPGPASGRKRKPPDTG